MEPLSSGLLFSRWWLLPSGLCIKPSRTAGTSNAYYIISPISDEHPELTGALRRLAEDLQAIPMQVEVEKHDAAVAAVSHLPHIVASSLVNIVKASDDAQHTLKTIAAGGFRDITRIAPTSSAISTEKL